MWFKVPFHRRRERSYYHQGSISEAQFNLDRAITKTPAELEEGNRLVIYNKMHKDRGMFPKTLRDLLGVFLQKIIGNFADNSIKVRTNSTVERGMYLSG